ncbi:uncharacterized protein LOC132551175 [Ylistrum balloti]|uniref:uncharacterized protein LOC132551175 n=1 Tax=Ylistrum balloti TaxID=509963 RepID=UPI002905ABCE|nr:uncharacterized protein LOC132551175 [Ylistrum balloti]
MGKTFKQRIQNLFSCCSIKPKRPEEVVSSPPYYPDLRGPYFTAESVVGIRDISGIDLSTVSHVTCPESYPVPVARNQKKFSLFRRRNRVAPMPEGMEDVIVRGTLCQDSIGPLFVNRQCTTMAYEALAYQARRRHPETWTSMDIDNIIRLGHRQHSQFRIVDKLSTHIDQKVGVYQLPEEYQVRNLPTFLSMGNCGSSLERKGVTATMLSSVDGCFQYENRDFAEALSAVSPEFPAFMAKTFESNPKAAVHMVLTIGEYSMAVWRRKDDNRLWLFDSHRRGPRGDNNVIPTDPGAALMRSFRNLDALMTHLIIQCGTNFSYSAALIGYDEVKSCSSQQNHGLEIAKCESKLGRMSHAWTEWRYIANIIPKSNTTHPAGSYTE